MRYRDTGDYQNLGVLADNNLVLLSITLGVGFIAAGLILASLSYFVMRMLGCF